MTPGPADGMTASRRGPASAINPMIALASLLCAALLVALVPMVAAAVPQTQAAWADRTYARATVTAGTWQSTPVTPPCAVVTSAGQPVPSSSCTVTGVQYTQWSDSATQYRDYYIAVQTTGQGSTAPLVSVDLTTGTASAGSAPGAWAWGTAVSLSTGQYTTPSDYACSELPRFRGTGPANWGSSFTIWVRVAQNAAAAPAAGRTCR